MEKKQPLNGFKMIFTMFSGCIVLVLQYFKLAYSFVHITQSAVYECMHMHLHMN